MFLYYFLLVAMSSILFNPDSLASGAAFLSDNLFSVLRMPTALIWVGVSLDAEGSTQAFVQLRLDYH